MNKSVRKFFAAVLLLSLVVPILSLEVFAEDTYVIVPPDCDHEYTLTLYWKCVPYNYDQHKICEYKAFNCVYCSYQYEEFTGNYAYQDHYEGTLLEKDLSHYINEKGVLCDYVTHDSVCGGCGAEYTWIVYAGQCICD